MHNKAFSLIELMVVVAVVASLSVIAALSYRNHRIDSRIASFYPVTDTIIADTKLFMQRTGRNVTGADLGLTPYSGPLALAGHFDPPGGTNEYVKAIGFGSYFSCNIPGATAMISYI